MPPPPDPGCVVVRPADVVVSAPGGAGGRDARARTGPALRCQRRRLRAHPSKPSLGHQRTQYVGVDSHGLDINSLR